MARRPLIVRVIQPTWTLLNELALNIRTTPPEQSSPAESAAQPADTPSDPRPRHNDSARYEVPDYFYMRRVLQVLSPAPEDVVFDLGCGLGRFLCLAARRKIRKCVGIELRSQLCKAAQENAGHLRGRRAPIEVRCGDAATADMSGGTIYYMYNPFGPTTMRDVLANIHASLSTNPRTIKIAYYNSIHDELFQASRWLEKYQSFRVKSGMPVTFWRSRPGIRA
jgi:predicted RNA methylase